MVSGNRDSRSQELSSRLVELLEWPHGIARLAAALCAAVSVAVLLYEVPRAVRDLGRSAGRSAALSYADREIAGGNSILVDQQAAYQARALIPARGTFRVVTGNGLKQSTPLTLPAVSGWLTYFLMPRRQAPDARWVICYGCDQSRLGGPYHPVWQNTDAGISIGTVG